MYICMYVFITIQRRIGSHEVTGNDDLRELARMLCGTEGSTITVTVCKPGGKEVGCVDNVCVCLGVCVCVCIFGCS